MDVKEKAAFWLNSPIDQETTDEINKLLQAGSEDLLKDAFYKNLEFGTGGMRGIMGVGSNRINKYTIGMATQGLANYLLKCFPNDEIKVAIAYDSRINSQHFAETAADVLSASNITVFLFPELRPTPELSFTIRQMHCQSGIVITASHNPREYNGYKVYWDDGGQILPPHDKNIIEEVNKIAGPGEINFQAKKEKINNIGPDIDEKFVKAIKDLVKEDHSAKELSVVYTPLHGTGVTLIPSLLKDLGYVNLHVVEEQSIPDGNFPTVVYPNPEEAEALTKAISLAKEVKADLILATDPDADRVGIAIRNHEGNYELLNGNQTGILLMTHLMKYTSDTTNSFIAKTIVTTDMIDEIARDLGINCYNTLTGFKYIAEVIRNKEGKESFIGGCEESYGYMIGDFVRDKDAVSACALIAELAEEAKLDGKNLGDNLDYLYIKYGHYLEHLTTFTKKGITGAEEISSMMENFRNNPPDEINHSKVIRKIDYKLNSDRDLISNTTKKTGLPKSDVLQFFTEDGSKISVRPSGTEPKIKFYFSVNRKVDKKEQLQESETILKQRIDDIINSLNLNN